LTLALLLGDLALHLAEQSIGGIASPLVLLWRHVGHVAEPATTRVLRRDDRRGPSPLSLTASAPFVRITGPRCFFVGAGLTIAGTSSATAFRFLGGRL
jgi:hypothetical protein